MKAARISSIVLLLLGAILAASCQSATRASSSTAHVATTGATTTTGAGPSLTIATTAPLPTTTDSGETEPPTESTLAASPDVVKYASEVVAWSFFQGVIIGDDLDRLRDIDITNMSACDLQVADRVTVHIQQLSKLLHTIKVPAEVAGVHEKLVAGMEARFAIHNRELTAMRNKDQAGVDAAKEATAMGGPESLRSAGTEWIEKYGEIGRRGWESIILQKTQYQAEVMAWIKAFRAWASTDGGDEMTLETYDVEMTDPAQVARAHDFGDQLRSIEPPAAMAAVHQNLVSAFDAWLAVLDQQLAAGKEPDQATLDPVETAYTGAMEEWLMAQFPSVPLPMD